MLVNHDVVEFYVAADESFSAGDIAQLEELASLGPFPQGVDGWYGGSWLAAAVETRNLASVEWVLRKKPDLSHIGRDGRAALRVALEVERDRSLPRDEAAALTIQLIDQLLGAGADIDQEMMLDVTLLHLAAIWSSPEVVKHLLARGADPNAISYDYSPKTPDQDAADLKWWNVCEILREARKKASESDGSSWFPIVLVHQVKRK